MSANLLISILLGGIVFVFVVLALWLLSGRPKGAESFLVDYALRAPVLRTLANKLQRES